MSYEKKQQQQQQTRIAETIFYNKRMFGGNTVPDFQLDHIQCCSNKKHMVLL